MMKYCKYKSNIMDKLYSYTVLNNSVLWCVHTRPQIDLCHLKTIKIFCTIINEGNICFACQML